MVVLKTDWSRMLWIVFTSAPVSFSIVPMPHHYSISQIENKETTKQERDQLYQLCTMCHLSKRQHVCPKAQYASAAHDDRRAVCFCLWYSDRIYRRINQWGYFFHFRDYCFYKKQKQVIKYNKKVYAYQWASSYSHPEISGQTGCRKSLSVLWEKSGPDENHSLGERRISSALQSISRILPVNCSAVH